MLEHFKAGGWGMFPILIIGLVMLGAAAAAAGTGKTTTRRFALRLSPVVAWMTVVAVTTDVMTVMYFLARRPSVDATILCQGLGESLSPAVLGAGFLALTHLLAAVGHRREDERVPA